MTVLLRDESGQALSMQLVGTEALVCNNFRQGNIVGDVQIVSGIAPYADMLNLLLDPPHPKAAEEFHDRHRRFVKQKIGQNKDGSLSLVSIDPSYGCKRIALCREVAISSGS